MYWPAIFLTIHTPGAAAATSFSRISEDLQITYWIGVKRMESYPDLCADTPFMRVYRKANSIERLAMAKKDIEKNTVVFKSEAYYSVLRREYLRSRCSNCLAPNPPKRCSKCSVAQYCSEKCQLHDFFIGAHRRECPQLSKVLGLLTDPYLSETRFLMRTIHNSHECSKSSKGKKVDVCYMHPDGVTSCGMSHYNQLSTQCSFDPDARQNRALVQFMREHSLAPSSVPTDMVIAEMKSLRTNSFGLFSDVFFTIGSGIFPQAALLNHSCEPNIVLSYWYRQTEHKPPLCVGIASRAIAENEELTHSYVDASLPVAERRAQLEELRGFVCKCKRCLLQEQSYSAFFSFTTEEIDLINELTRHFGDPLKLKEILAADEMDRIRLPAIVERLLNDEKSCYSFDNYQNNSKSLEIQMQETLDNITSTDEMSVKVENCQKAVALLKRITSFLVLSLHHIPMHPLVPIQIFTLADLLFFRGEDGDEASREESKRYYQWCSDVLSVTHPLGPSGSDLLNRLFL